MFNIKELSKIFKYNYKNFFINMKPRDNKRVISNNTFNNILSSVILLFMGYIISIIVLINSIPLASQMVVNYFGIGKSSVISNILVLVFPMVILVYTLVNKEKEQTGKNYFIILCISLLLIIILLFRIITFIGISTLNNFLGLVGLISIVISLIGYGFLIVGIIDYLILLKRDYLNLTTTFRKVEIKTSTIDVDDISMH